MADGDSFAAALTALHELEKDVHADLVTYRWRPREKPDLPALWHWPSVDNPFELTDTISGQDTIRVSTYIGAEPAPTDEQTEQLEVYVDAYRNLVDPALDQNQPLDDTVIMAKRLGMRPVLDDFGGINVLCFEFPLELKLNRILNP